MWVRFFENPGSLPGLKLSGGGFTFQGFQVESLTHLAKIKMWLKPVGDQALPEKMGPHEIGPEFLVVKNALKPGHLT